jgi:hypothetical protein
VARAALQIKKLVALGMARFKIKIHLKPLHGKRCKLLNLQVGRAEGETHLLTRNAGDFRLRGLTVLNPWDAP